MADKPKIFGVNPDTARVDRRKSSHKRGYDGRWRKLRDAFKVEHPLCDHCILNMTVTESTEIDHIKPFKGLDDPLRLDPSNLQALCRSCHAKKNTRRKGITMIVDVFYCILSICVLIVSCSLLRLINSNTIAVELIIDRNTLDDIPQYKDGYQMINDESIDDIYTIIEDVINERMHDDDTSSWNLPEGWDRNGDN